MENNILTAEDFMNSKQFEPDEGITFEEYHGDNVALVPYMMVQFAKMHVKAALEAAANKSTVDICDWEPLTDMARNAEMLPVYGVDENSIRNAYPLNLIK